MKPISISTPKASYFADLICDEVNVKDFSIDCGKDKQGNVIKLNYNQKSKEWYWLKGQERKEVKDKNIIDRIYDNRKTIISKCL